MNKLFAITVNLVLGLLLCVCSSGGSDTATISISLRKLPGKAAVGIEQLRHDITLSGPTGVKTISIKGAGTASASVMPGTWNISVQGFMGEELYSVGSASAEVKPGKTSNVSVQMTVVWSDSAGVPSSGSVPGRTYGISLSESGTLAFTTAGEGYYLEPLTVTITNTGSDGTGLLNVGITGSDSSSFSIILSAPISDIPPGGTHTFTIVQASSLVAGPYNDATVTVDDGGANGIAESFGLSFTVLAPDGTQVAPWLVTNASDLVAVGTGSPTGWDLDKSYKQTNPITLTTSWAPIGPLTGNYDGGGNIITLPSVISPSGVYAGLFSQIASSGEVKNLALKGTVTVNFSDTGYCYAGVVAGENNGTIRNVSSSVAFTASNFLSGVYIGGIAGQCNASGTPGIITNCYSTNNISGTTTVDLGLGGILGRRQSGPGSVSYCWAEGNLSPSAFGHAGGIVGDDGGGTQNTTNCVALHGLIGSNPTDTRILGIQANAGLSDNFANASMVYGNYGNVGHDMSNGEPVPIATTEAANGAWWTGADGPKWTAFWGGADADDAMPWHWDSVNLRPILWFESTVNR